jgi:hypothetical protein
MDNQVIRNHNDTKIIKSSGFHYVSPSRLMIDGWIVHGQCDLYVTRTLSRQGHKDIYIYTGIRRCGIRMFTRSLV